MTRARWAAILVSGFLLLGGCGGQPPAGATFTLAGTVEDWNQGTPTIEAAVWPAGHVLDAGAMSAEGTFSLGLPGTVDRELLRPFRDIHGGAGCTTVRSSDTAARFAVVRNLNAPEAEQTIVAGSSESYAGGTFREGEWGVLWWYSNRSVDIEATCTGSGGGAQNYTLSLVRGWSAVVATVVNTSGPKIDLGFTVHGGEAPNWYALEVP